MKALVIDPSRAYRKLFCSVLADNNFTSQEVDGYVEAQEACHAETFQLICMSLMLSDGDSHELVLRIRASQENSSTPILMLTSNYKRETLEKAFATGVTEVFRKEDFALFESYLRQFSEQLQPEEPATGRILYVEDNRSVAAATAALLQDSGHEVDHCVSVEEALLVFEEHAYDLVLTDMLLEGELSGSALVRAIRHHEAADKSSVPVVAISAFSDNARRIELFRSGINDYVQKPVLGEELLARVHNLVKTQLLTRQLDAQHKRMQELAMVDQLTGLYNRHFLMEAVPKRIAQARRQSFPLSLLVADVDHFKQVNDTHGHAVGDDVLRAVAAVLQRKSREEDVVARYGGEEFVLLLDHCDLQQAVAKAEELRLALASLNPVGIAVTASFGVSGFDQEFDGFTEIFQRADKAVYRAKSSGRNCVQSECED